MALVSLLLTINMQGPPIRLLNDDLNISCSLVLYINISPHVLVVFLVIVLVLVPPLFLDHHARAPATDTVIPHVIPPLALEVHILLLLALPQNIFKVRTAKGPRVEGDAAIAPLHDISAIITPRETTMGVRVRILLHLLDHETTTLLVILLGHLVHLVNIPRGLRRGDLPRLLDVHRRHPPRLAPVVRRDVLRQEGGGHRRSQVAQRQQHHERDERVDQLLHHARALVNPELFSDDGVDLLVGEVAATLRVAIAHGLFGFVEDSIAVEVVGAGDGGEAFFFFEGDGFGGGGVFGVGVDRFVVLVVEVGLGGVGWHGADEGWGER
mmetsp:Transcript_21115/g.32025  ORF Transcript_21115/g.32025 Transcript_21115/m.32025 type:complete len:324 (-) Transcript_21115:80-1051(-)